MIMTTYMKFLLVVALGVTVANPALARCGSPHAKTSRPAVAPKTPAMAASRTAPTAPQLTKRRQKRLLRASPANFLAARHRWPPCQSGIGNDWGSQRLGLATTGVLPVAENNRAWQSWHTAASRKEALLGGERLCAS